MLRPRIAARGWLNVAPASLAPSSQEPPYWLQPGDAWMLNDKAVESEIVVLGGRLQRFSLSEPAIENARVASRVLQLERLLKLEYLNHPMAWPPARQFDFLVELYERDKVRCLDFLFSVIF